MTPLDRLLIATARTPVTRKRSILDYSARVKRPAAVNRR
jgi:hypothetical protein